MASRSISHGNSNASQDKGKRRALVTGAAHGLAAGIAPLLAHDGFGTIAITYRNTPPDETLAAIETAGASGGAVRVDFLDEVATIEAALRDANERYGPFDTLVHGVGPLPVKRFTDATIDDYREAIDGNLRSAILTAKATLPAMREARFGRMIFFGMPGSSETRPFKSLSLYQSAKSGLVAFARSLALEEAPHGITINVVSPGDIRDKGIDRAQARERQANNPRGRPGSYEDVADTVRFLVAPERDFITGAVIEVTGGLQSAQEKAR